MTNTSLEWYIQVEDRLQKNFISARTAYRQALKHDQGNASPRLKVMLKAEEKLNTIRSLIIEIQKMHVSVPPPTSTQESKTAKLLDELDKVLHDNERVSDALHIMSELGSVLTERIS